jgi:hypothetical protein
MKAHFFRVTTADEHTTLAIAAVCLPQRYCGVFWRGSLAIVREDRDLDVWEAAAKELLSSTAPRTRGVVARLILDPALEQLGLKTILLESTYVHRRTTVADWDQMLRVRFDFGSEPSSRGRHQPRRYDDV